MKIEIPTLTHLQYAVLSGSSLEVGQTGQEIRKKLASIGLDYSGPKFYQFMARLEEGGWLVGEYTDKKLSPTFARERRYTSTKKAIKAVQISFRFYHHF